MAAQAVNAAVDRVGRALFTSEDDRAAAADLALADLRQTLGLEAAHLMLAPKSGPLILDAGTPPVDHVRESRGVVLMFPLGEGFSLSLSASHGPSRHLSPLDRRVIDAVAQLFALWARQVAQPLPVAAAPERRSGHVRFDEMIERLTRQALERGEPVTLIVAVLADDAAADATATIATGVRSQLRPWDVVGVLRDREVGFLLHDTSRDQALRIVGRIRAFVESTERGHVSAVGVASRGGPDNAGAAGATSIVQEARDRAVRRNVA
jgi:GGDEF domain-containing protein